MISTQVALKMNQIYYHRHYIARLLPGRRLQAVPDNSVIIWPLPEQWTYLNSASGNLDHPELFSTTGYDIMQQKWQGIL